jgi:hypothetical protein
MHAAWMTANHCSSSVQVRVVAKPARSSKVVKDWRVYL